MREVLIGSFSVIAIVVSIASLIYGELLNQRYEKAVILLNSLEKDVEHFTKALTAYREDKLALYERVDDLDREMATARAAMEEWKEAGELAKKSEKDFNEGLNNIINYQPVVSKKGDEN